MTCRYLTRSGLALRSVPQNDKAVHVEMRKSLFVWLIMFITGYRIEKLMKRTCRLEATRCVMINVHADKLNDRFDHRDYTCEGVILYREFVEWISLMSRFLDWLMSCTFDA